MSKYLDADGEEHAARAANQWIKALRHARVDGVTFRERFTYLGDSLWWFAELYLHKERVVLSLFRAISAFASLLEREAPTALWLDEGTSAVRLIVEQMAAARGVSYDGPPRPRTSRAALIRMDARSTALLLGAVLSPLRPSRLPRRSGVKVAAFVHRAFWRGDDADATAESYIGPVLRALEDRLQPAEIHYIGVGPTTNFRARKWWRRNDSTAPSVEPIEALTSRDRLAGSIGLWMGRHAMRRALWSSAELRAAAVIGGCDCWPVIQEALAGIALLQFPWSARAMDEAGAAFDALEPSAALTYAEAGGWGRALVLEARRRHVPFAGLQHGFIYRHWLNYLHQPDEMRPLGADSTDRGFPLPSLTLLFDEYALRHLREAGQFPESSMRVTGSARLDVLSARFRTLTPAVIAATRQTAGADPPQPLVLLVTKYTDVRSVLPALLTAFGAIPEAQFAIKTHPAETPAPYVEAAAGMPNVRVLPAGVELAPLIRASRALITVNSTVALDAMVLGVPALSVALPNNLTPFVSMGALAGAHVQDDLESAIRRLLYDEEFRQRLSATSSAVVAEYGMAPQGDAAERSASAILELAGAQRGQE